jgi:hypothetical protein
LVTPRIVAEDVAYGSLLRERVAYVLGEGGR